MSEIDLFDKFSINQTSIITSTARIHPKYLHTNSNEYDVVKNVQQKRRQEFMDHVQKKREILIEQMRNLIENDSIEVDDDDDVHLESSKSNDKEINNQNDNDDEIKMEIESSFNKISNRKNVKKRIIRQKNYRKSISDCFMLSEWLVDVPDDFFNDWFFVCCPKGRRTLLIANNGHTRVYNRHGNFLFKFNSTIPGGSSGVLKSAKSILDCIWIESQRKFYILDVFIWNNCSFYGCDTEFRFYWIHNHIQNNEINDDDMIQVKTLPYWQCTISNLRQYAENGSYPFDYDIDGILFYHKRAPYMSGITPLVCWLKVSMLKNIIFSKISQ